MNNKTKPKTNMQQTDKAIADIDAQIARTADPMATDRLYKKRDRLATTASAQPRVSMLLSTGRTVAHERMSNGAQHAYIVGSATGEMTENEWSEYCELLRKP
jgi:hypothetical protein